MSEDTERVVCYESWNFVIPACGGENRTVTFFPEHATCENCRKTKIWREHVILKEVGFDGKFLDFFQHLQKEVVKD